MTSVVPDRWLEVRIPVKEGPLRSFVSEILVDEGARGVQEIETFLLTYFPPPPDAEAFVRRLAKSIQQHSGESVQEVDWRWQDHEDWETLWRQGLGPRHIGARLVVRPSWTPYEPRSGDLVLTIDPGIAFGTAEHGTTRTALQLVERLVRPGSRVADVGTGTGILAIAAALLGAEHVAAFDTDPYACDAARENAALNRVASRVSVIDGSLPADGVAFDGVVANIEWLRLAPLVPTLAARAGPHGWLVLAGILMEQRGEALDALGEQELRRVDEVGDGEWWAVALVL